MERQPDHLVTDPNLRRPFVNQQSLDEYMDDALEALRQTQPDNTYLTDQDRKTEVGYALAAKWANTLDPDTSVNEWLYLAGYVDPVTRKSKLEEIPAGLRYAAVSQLFMHRMSQNTEPGEENGE